MLGYFLGLASEDRFHRLNALAETLGLALPPAPDAEHAPCIWDDVRAMSRAGIEIGAHTVTHPRLPVEADQSLAAELDGSKRRIEEEIGLEVTSFCYPNGSPADYDDRVAQAVKAAGYRCAVVAHFDGQPGDLFRLRRLGVGRDMFQYRKSITGVEHVGKRLFRTQTTTHPKPAPTARRDAARS
jgi:peptidoglycan/xylan/chitin deacetylase (PgdA/CDA1 family)